jgi:hypothetical protein
VSAGWASPLSHGLCGGDGLLPSTGAASNRNPSGSDLLGCGVVTGRVPWWHTPASLLLGGWAPTVCEEVKSPTNCKDPIEIPVAL